MKLKTLLIAGLFSFLSSVYACDLCSIYINLEPNDLRNSIGLNYRYRLFEYESITFTALETKGKHAAGNTTMSEARLQQEVFNSYDLWANYFIGTNWQINANFSFVDNYYHEEDSNLYSIGGPGDFSLVVKYLIFNTKVTDSGKIALRWLVGGGIKLPTGKYNKTYVVSPETTVKDNTVYGTPYTELDPHLQAGTGSLDYLLLSELLVRFNKVGLSTNFSYRINSTNSNQFRFANRLNSNLNLFYLLKMKKNAFAPNVGLSYEFSKRDQLNNRDYLNSGGQVLFANAGAKIYIGDFAFGFTYFNPINQNLNDNQLPNKRRMTGDLTFYF